MSSSDLITIWSIAIGLFVTIVGSALLLAFKIGGLHQQIVAMARDLEKMKAEIAKIKYTLGQVLVKVEVLWKAHIAKSDKAQH